MCINKKKLTFSMIINGSSKYKLLYLLQLHVSENQSSRNQLLLLSLAFVKTGDGEDLTFFFL